MFKQINQLPSQNINLIEQLTQHNQSAKRLIGYRIQTEIPFNYPPLPIAPRQI